MVLLRLALLPILGVPVPGGHDEFSQLLPADTFAHGRLTNPAHPMWIHFESFHIIHQPTYSSIYPPAQGLVLAAGQLLGHPWIGELLITALMCAAICWMLQGWLPPKWALFGAMLAVLRLGVFSYWMDGYWATSVVALGGALLLGALPRITRQQRQQRQQRIGDALWLALGLAILANTRPYEGLVLAAIVGAALLIWMLGPAGPALGVSLKRIVAPAGLLLAVTALATGYFYYRVGGSPFRLTYVVDSQIYNPVPFFLWQQPGPLPAYNHETLRQFYELDLQRWVEHRAQFLDFSIYRAAGIYFTYVGPYLAIPLLVMPWLWRDRGMRFALIAGALFLVALLGESWSLPHYAAPATGLLFLIVAQCSRRIALLKLFRFRIGRRRRAGDSGAGRRRPGVTHGNRRRALTQTATLVSQQSGARRDDEPPRRASGETRRGGGLRAGARRRQRMGLQQRRHRRCQGRLGARHGRREESGVAALLRRSRVLDDHRERQDAAGAVALPAALARSARVRLPENSRTRACGAERLAGRIGQPPSRPDQGEATSFAYSNIVVAPMPSDSKRSMKPVRPLGNVAASTTGDR